MQPPPDDSVSTKTPLSLISHDDNHIDSTASIGLLTHIEQLIAATVSIQCKPSRLRVQVLKNELQVRFFYEKSLENILFLLYKYL